MRRPQLVRLIPPFVAILFAAVYGILGIAIVFSMLVDVVPIPFDSAAWKRSDAIENHRTVRSQMVDALIISGKLKGLSQNEAEELLGSPLSDMNAAGVDGTYWSMAYYLGLERSGSWSLDDEFFVIRLNADKRVVEYRTVVN